MKFQITERCLNSRGQLFNFLQKNFDVKIISHADEVSLDRIFLICHPIDIWILDVVKKYNLNFFTFDNGYIGNHRYKKCNYYRISYNSFQNTTVKSVDYSRIDTLEIDNTIWREWNTSGDYELVVLPKKQHYNKLFYFMDIDFPKWLDDSITFYKNRPDTIVRLKPLQKRKFRYNDIFDLISNSSKVITFHSMAAVEAICLGKPVQILGESVVSEWSNKDNVNRDEVLEHISWSQFSREEFDNGVAWDCTFKYQIN